MRPEAASTRLHGRALVAARAAWIVLAALTLALFAVGTVVAAQRLSVVCYPPRCAAGQVADTDVPSLRGLHLSVQFYAAYVVSLQALFTLTYAAVAALIFWRRSDDRLALFISLTLLLFGAATFSPGSFTSMVDYARAAYPAWWVPATSLIFLGSVSFIAFLLIFPDGRFRPAWMAWLALAWAAFQFPRCVVRGECALHRPHRRALRAAAQAPETRGGSLHPASTGPGHIVSGDGPRASSSPPDERSSPC